MIKNEFYKNLYQSISYFCVTITLSLPCIGSFIISLQSAPNYGWIMLIFPPVFFVLYFSVGFYWIFQKVKIDESGIEITLLNKTIRKVKWENVERIQSGSFYCNPVYVLYIQNEKNLNLDERKAIKEAILFYGKLSVDNANV